MPNDYITVAELKDAIDAPTTDIQQFSTTDYDTFLSTTITRASRLIDIFTNREPGAYAVSADTVRYFNGSGTDKQYIGEIAANPTTVGVAESASVDTQGSSDGTYTTYGSTDYWMFPYNATLERIPYTEIHLNRLNGSRSAFYAQPRGVKITGKFGYAEATSDSTTTIPEIAQATVIQAGRLFKRSQQAFHDAGANVALGQLVYVKKLDPDVENIILHLRRIAV